MFNMTAIATCLSFTNLKFAAFKGDDMYVIAQDYKHNIINEKTIADICGYKLKLESPRICEYIANIITPHGFFPDVVRRVGRVVSKIYTTQDDWQEMKKSVSDSIDVVLDDFNLVTGCEIASQYYNQYGIDLCAKEVEQLLRFLRHVSNMASIDDFPLNTWSIATVYNNSSQ
jgi:hypothetical protein